MAKWAKSGGFTVVELIIVIVVAGALASVLVLGYGGAQQKARQGKIEADITTLTEAIQVGRIRANKTLMTITGSTYSAGACTGKPTGTDLAGLTASDACIVAYRAALNAISSASGDSLGDIRDPWGRPYLIDENEGESGGCSKDTVAVYKYPFTTGYGTYTTTPGYNVPLSGVSGC